MLYGLGKKRTVFGKWADREGLSQKELMAITGINKNTMTELCSNLEYSPHDATMIKVISGLRREGYDVSMSDFW